MQRLYQISNLSENRRKIFIQSQIFSLHFSIIRNIFAIKAFKDITILFKIVYIGFKVLERVFKVLERAFKVLERAFNVLKTESIVY